EFLLLCEQVTERVRLTRERLQRLDDEKVQRVLIAVPQSLLSHFLLPWRESLGQQERLHPYLRATGWLLSEYFQALERGECDLALCYWPVGHGALDIDTGGFAHRVVGAERLVPVSAPDQHGKPRYALPGSRHTPLPWIAYHPRSLLNAAIQAHLSRSSQACHLNVLNEGIQTSVIQELLIHGYGFGWLPERVAHNALQEGRLV